MEQHEKSSMTYVEVMISIDEGNYQGCDPLHMEDYLTDDEFVKFLGMTREEFTPLPKWKRDRLKKNKHLF
jgi:hypothetical protein